MRTDQAITAEYRLSRKQHMFADCWFNLIHEASIDSFRVRAMNPLNMVDELLRILDARHANDADRVRVIGEAKLVLAEDLILSSPVFNPARAELRLLLERAGAAPKPAAPGHDKKQAENAKPGKAKSVLAESQSLIEAFARELQHLLREHYLRTVIDWLKAKLAAPDAAIDADERRDWAHIEVATSTMLSVLVHLGWSFQSLYVLYTTILIPRRIDEKKPYDFAAALDSALSKLLAPSDAYDITFTIRDVSKPAQFPKSIGEIRFSTRPPEVPRPPSELMEKFLKPAGNKLFATLTVKAQEARMAATSGDQISQVLDVVRYGYERKNPRLSESFVAVTSGKQMYLKVPGTVSAPFQSLTAEQLGEFMERLTNLVVSDGLRQEARSRVFSTFRLYRTGSETSNFENKLVNWWTALEFMVKGSSSGAIGDGVEKAIKSTVALAYVPKHLRTLLNDLAVEIPDPAAGTPVAFGSLPLASLYGLLKSQAARDAVLAACASRPFVSVHVKRLLAYVENPQNLQSTMTGHAGRLGWHIQRVYRARCDIVHSAGRVVNAAMLCANLEYYLQTVLTTFLDALHRHPTLRSPKEFFDRQQRIYENLIEDLKGNRDDSLIRLIEARDSSFL
ncbi:hypothetical protein VSR34_36380 [Paraburkholderia sp. JHI2823]|uniref:hypothetical protein n=1 Tax=Paraburkholderia sp. JHI2823 TaxID=3112960 RepID=UPI00317A7514